MRHLAARILDSKPRDGGSSPPAPAMKAQKSKQEAEIERQVIVQLERDRMAKILMKRYGISKKEAFKVILDK